jgi:hypothetical protein
MSTLNVELENLEPGQRYFYTIIERPMNNEVELEGTFQQFIVNPRSHNTYIFTDIVKYVRDPKPNKPNNMKKIKIGDSAYNGAAFYPRNIRLYEFNQLPDELNRMISAYGVKSRKMKKIKKIKKNKKSKRRNRKSKKI